CAQIDRGHGRRRRLEGEAARRPAAGGRCGRSHRADRPCGLQLLEDGHGRGAGQLRGGGAGGRGRGAVRRTQGQHGVAGARPAAGRSGTISGCHGNLSGRVRRARIFVTRLRKEVWQVFALRATVTGRGACRRRYRGSEEARSMDITAQRPPAPRTSPAPAAVTLRQSYAAAVPDLSVPWQADAPADPALAWLNEDLAAELGYDPAWLRGPEGIALLTGQLDDDGRPLPAGATAPQRPFTTAQAYGGHQFGSPNPQLGD